MVVSAYCPLKLNMNAAILGRKVYIVAGSRIQSDYSDKVFAADLLGSASFTLAAGTGDKDNAAFTIVGNELKLNESADFETQNEYSIRVKGTDTGGLSIEKVFTISVTDVPENVAPVGITHDSNTIAENSPADTIIGTLSAIDPDEGDTHTFTLTDPAQHPDNSAFTIDGNQLKTATTFDFETKDSYTISVQVTDASGLSFSQVISVEISNQFEIPTYEELLGEQISLLENLDYSWGVELIPNGDMNTDTTGFHDIYGYANTPEIRTNPINEKVELFLTNKETKAMLIIEYSTNQNIPLLKERHFCICWL